MTKPFKLLLTLAMLLVGQCAWGATLLDNLVAAYEWNSTGNDLTANANNLTNNNSATFTTGKPAAATTVARASSQYWSIADNASLSMGDVDFTVCFWVNFTTLPGAAEYPGLVGKWGTTTREWTAYYNKNDERITWIVTSDGTAFTSLPWGSAITAGTWYWVVCTHDATNDTIGISVDNGTEVTVSHAGGVFDGTHDFEVGRTNDGSFSGYADATFGQVLVYKNRLLTTLERDRLYNSGSGLPYSQFPANNFNFGPFFMHHKPAQPAQRWKLTNEYAMAPITGNHP